VSETLARLGSYELDEERAVESKDGTAGVLLHYVRAESGQEQDYAIALFIKRDARLLFPRERLFVVESGGPRSVYEKRRAQVEAALSSLELDLPL
jgi:hypothetical protein